MGEKKKTGKASAAAKRRALAKRRETLRPRTIRELREELAAVARRLGVFARQHKREDVWKLRLVVLRAAQTLQTTPLQHELLAEWAKYAAKEVADRNAYLPWPRPKLIAEPPPPPPASLAWLRELVDSALRDPIEDEPCEG